MNKQLRGDYQTKTAAAYIYALAGNKKSSEAHYSQAKTNGMDNKELAVLHQQILQRLN
ncbi:MAG: hypothetical protein ACJAVV_000758 [Alphaproteobacteria bacterium]|jgi:hypothetical protein